MFRFRVANAMHSGWTASHEGSKQYRFLASKRVALPYAHRWTQSIRRAIVFVEGSAEVVAAEQCYGQYQKHGVA